MFHGDYAMEVNVPTYTQVILENKNYSIVAWDSSVFVSFFLIQTLLILDNNTKTKISRLFYADRMR